MRPLAASDENEIADSAAGNRWRRTDRRMVEIDTRIRRASERFDISVAQQTEIEFRW
jgi:hypothetical protein